MMEDTYAAHYAHGAQGNPNRNYSRRLTRIGWRDLIITATRSARPVREMADYTTGLSEGAYHADNLQAILYFYNIRGKMFEFESDMDSVQMQVEGFLNMTGRPQLGNVRREYGAFKSVINIAARIYKNLVINLQRQRCFYTVSLNYTTANETAGTATLTCMSHLRAENNLVATEVLYLAMRIAKVLRDQVTYDINSDGHAVLNTISVRIPAGSGFGAMTHSVRGGITVDDFWNLTEHMDDTSAKASFDGLRRYLMVNRRQLASPSTTMNCLVSAMLMARDQMLYPTDPRDAHNFSQKASKIMTKLHIEDDTDVDRTLYDIVDGFAQHELHEGYSVAVHNMFGDVVYVVDGKSFKHAALPKSARKHIRILVFAGHALALVDINLKLGDIEDIPREYYENIKTTEQRRRDLESRLRKRNVDYEETYPTLNFGVYDIETLGDDVTPYAIGWKSEITEDTSVMIKYGLNTCIKAFFDWIYENCKEYYVFYAHNGGKFDLPLLMNYLFGAQGRFKIISMLMHSGRVISAKVLLVKSHPGPCNAKKIVVEFRDSFAMIPASQEKIAKSMSIQTQKGHMNHDIINADNVDDQWRSQNIRQYLYQDVQGLYEILYSFNAECAMIFGFSPLLNCLATSGISRIFFLSSHSRYNSTMTPLCRLTKEEGDQNKEAYHGGISDTLQVCEYPSQEKIQESMETHHSNLTYGDIVSLYPYMMQFLLPFGPPHTILVTERNFVDFFGFLHVKVRGGRIDKFNCIYIKDEVAGLIAPHFEVWTDVYIFSEELRFAYVNREFFRYEFIFGEGQRFSAGNVLKKTSAELFQFKAQEKKGTVGYMVKKLVLNALYGCPATRREGTVVDVTENPRQLLKYFWTGALKEVRVHKSFIMYKAHKEIDVSFRYVPLSTAIAAYGRAYMNRIRMKIEIAGGTTFQIDTDGLVTDLTVDQLKAAGVNWGFHWGGMCHDLAEKKEDTIEIIAGVFIAPKVYALKGYVNGEYFEIVKCKGFPKRKWLRRVVEGDMVTFEGSSEEGTYKLGYDDIKHLLTGKIAYEQLRFVGGQRMWMMERPQLKRKIAKVVITGNINKGIVDPLTGLVYNLCVYLHFWTVLYAMSVNWACSGAKLYLTGLYVVIDV